MTVETQTKAETPQTFEQFKTLEDGTPRRPYFLITDKAGVTLPASACIVSFTFVSDDGDVIASTDTHQMWFSEDDGEPFAPISYEAAMEMLCDQSSADSLWKGPTVGKLQSSAE